MNKQVFTGTQIKTLKILLSAIGKSLLILVLILLIAPSIKSFAVVSKLTASPVPYTINAGAEKRITLKTNDSSFVGQKELTISGYEATSAGAGIITYYTDTNAVTTSTALNINSSTTIQAYFTKDSESSSYTDIKISLFKAMNTAKVKYSITDGTVISTTVSARIDPAEANKLEITQDISPPLTNGGLFSTQPQVAIRDKYGNIRTGDSNIITVSKYDSGPWTLEGTSTTAAINSVATFSDLRATNDQSVENIQLKFSSAGLADILSNAVVLPSKRFTVTFKDDNGTILKTEGVNYGSGATPPLVPGRLGYTFTGWDKAFDSITSETTVTAQYKSIQYILNVVNGTGSGTYKASSNVNATAAIPYGKYFTGWKDETGSIISYYDKYNFILTSNKTLTATFSDIPLSAVPTVSLDNNVIQLNVNDVYGKMYFTSTIAVPTGYSLVECGVVISKAVDIGLTKTNALKTLKSTAQNSAGQFYSIFNVTYDNTLYARAYVIYKDSEGNTVTKYSSNVVAAKMSKQ